MSKYIFMIILLFPVIMSISCAEKGTLSFANKNIDLGLIKKGSISKIEFRVKNNTHSQIQIHKIESSCGCTVVNYPKLIGISEDAVVSATFEASSIGSFSHSIKVTYGPKSHTESLSVKGLVNKWYELQPELVDFKINKEDASVQIIECLIKFFDKDKSMPIIKAVTSSNNYGEITSFFENCDEYFCLKIKYKFNAYSQIKNTGVIFDYINVEFDNMNVDFNPIRIPVKGILISGIEIEPKTVFLGSVKPNTMISSEITCKKTGPISLNKIDIVSNIQEEWACDIISKSTDTVKVKVSFKSIENKGGLKNGSIKLLFDGFPVITIPATVLVIK